MEYGNNNSEKTIVDSGVIREKLWRSGFYTKDKLEKLVEMFKANSNLSSYISSFNISPFNDFIELRFRNDYLKSNEITFYQNPIINQIMIDWYHQYEIDLIATLKEYHGIILSSRNDRYGLMYYHLSKISNTLIISFM